MKTLDWTAKILTKTAFVAVLLAAVSCAGRSTGEPARKHVNKPVANHVILIGFDGLAGYTFEDSDMPNSKALRDKGCYTLRKRTTLPSSSAINWASMFMGAGTELHGYTKWGSKTPELPSRVILKNNIFPTIFQVLRDARPDAEIGVMYDWDGIKYLVDTLSLNYKAQSTAYEENPCELGDMAADYIRAKKPNLLAVCFDNPDHVGHRNGWTSHEYYEMLSRIDSSVATIVNATREAGILDDTVFIISSDHGGINKGHGKISMEEMETVFIVSGKGIRHRGEIPESMMQFDVAATIAEILGISDFVPQVWTGRPMMSIFSR